MRTRKFRDGLENLVPTVPRDTAEPNSPSKALANALELEEGVNRLGEAREIALDQLHPNPRQPRQTFDEAALEELAASIREQGVLQPITVTPGDDGYQIVAGERRWRAARRAGLTRIPAMVRALSERDQFIVALMENLQREDLNDIDRARGLADLKSALGSQVPRTTSHELDDEAGRRLGLSGRAVRNFLALLTLPETIQRSIAAGSLTEKHGRAIRRVPQPELQRRVAEVAARLKLTGDETVALVRALRDDLEADVDQLAWRAKAGRWEPPRRAGEGTGETGAADHTIDAALRRLEEQVRRMEAVAEAAGPNGIDRSGIEKIAELSGRLARLAGRLKGEEPA